MIAKELRDAWWKLTIGAIAVLALAAVVVLRYERMMRIMPSPTNLNGEFGTVTGNVLVPLAAILGVGLISGEVGRNTIFLLLSKPLSRTHLLLTKYAVGAVGLLVVTVLGSIGVVVSAAVRGYPVGEFSVWGIVLSTLLMWIGSLCVLGITLLISVIFKDLMWSIVATVPAVYLLMLLPGPLMDVVLQSLPDPPHESFYYLSLTPLWTSGSLYTGNGLALTNFFVCLVAAAVPLLAALWLFRRKAY